MLTKKLYEEPTVDVTKLKICDVITTSGAYVPPSQGGSGSDPDTGTDGGKYDLPFDF